MALHSPNSVSAFEAKTHLSQLLLQVQQGSCITITKHNTPVAILVPVEPKKQIDEELINSIFLNRKQHYLNGLSIRSLIEEGRY